MDKTFRKMIRKSDYFEFTDKYINMELQNSDLIEFESQLIIDNELAQEVNLHKDIENAIQEKNIISLRQNLKNIVSDNQDNIAYQNYSFELTDELISFDNLESGAITGKNIIIDHSFPKIHIYQHKIAGNENLHQFYKEQSNKEESIEEYFDQIDEKLFSEIQLALEEKDIQEIKANLKHVAKSMPAHFYSSEQIDDYLLNRMNPDLIAQFEFDLSVNKQLAADLKLNNEINSAASEKDIISLRETLNAIQNINQNSDSTIKEIDAYLQNQLSDEQLAEFEAKLEIDINLHSEVALVKEIDIAINEKDILLLKQKLSNIAEQVKNEANKKSELSFIGKLMSKKAIVASVAASLILLLSITGIINRQSDNYNIYQKYYNTYQLTGITRSAESNTEKDLKMALEKFENKEFESALILFNKVISIENNNIANHFYAGVASQETGKFDVAIKQYQTVILNKDNLFIEQARWYLALCYLQTNENKKAIYQFKQIAQKEGFYKLKALAILRKLKYS